MGNERYVFWAEGVGKTFGKTVALKSASLWAEAGRVTTLLGRNGSGKTTLLRIAAGVLRADYGVVSLSGKVIERPALFGFDIANGHFATFRPIRQSGKRTRCPCAEALA